MHKRQSLFEAMERFVSAVGDMDGTVMVPSLLRDLPARHASDSASTSTATDGRDLFALYAQLKSVRSQIEWGALPPSADTGGASGGGGRRDKKKQQQQQQRQQQQQQEKVNNNNVVVAVNQQQQNGGSSGGGLTLKTALDVLMAQENDGDDDDGGDGDDDGGDDDDVEQRFRRHVSGLHVALHEMTQLARALTHRYKVEVNLGSVGAM